LRVDIINGFILQEVVFKTIFSYQIT